MRTVDGLEVMDITNTQVAVIGLGASGVAAARLALAKGAEVYVSDSRTETAVAARGADLRMAGASVDVGGHDVDRVARAGLVVVSPGIPPDAPVLESLASRDVGWVSEPEFAARFFDGSLIAITGTNGKTTTTLLVEHLLRNAGLRARAGGNVGGGLAPPASDLARVDDPIDWYVLEMSSFQLADVETFRPDIGVVTNLSPDHLDRYDSVESYYADKARLFENADARSQWVIPHGDEDVEALIGDTPGTRYTVGPEGADAVVTDGVMNGRLDGEPVALCPVDEVPLLGAHNVQNALMAAQIALLAGASPVAVGTGLKGARALPHRLEPVADENDVLWVNDSKATNVAAAVSALTSLDRPVILLAGGTDKGESMDALRAAADLRARVVLAYGEAGPRIATELGGISAVVEEMSGDFESVVERARALAGAGDAVLLSPACSSFDQFEDYEARGNRFRELVGGGR